MSKKTYFNSITLAKVADGAPANSLIIETEYDEILKFKEKSGVTKFTPDYLSFRVLDFSEGEYKENFGWALGYLGPAGYTDIVKKSELDEDPDHPYRYCFSQEREESWDTTKTSTVVYINTRQLYAQISEDDNLKSLKEQIDNGSAVLKIVYPETPQPQAIKYLNIKPGISGDMARLEIKADEILQVVQNTKCSFSESGLQIYDGGLIITKRNYVAIPKEQVNEGNYFNYYVLDDNDKYQPVTGDYSSEQTYFKEETANVFSFDENTGNLNIIGSGSFTGNIIAEGGSFTGNIVAEGGTIGGFSVDKEKMWSGNALILNGKNGEIEAEKIFLGNSARVYGSLSFADKTQEISTFTLHNPELKIGYSDEKGSVVLETAQVKLTNLGYLNLGTLELFGGTGNNDGYIRSINIDANGQAQNGWWRINENGTSYFDSIYANNAHIQNSILEIETVQSVGSTMVFSEAWTIEKNHTYFEVKKPGGTTQTKHWGFVLDKIGSVTFDDFVMINDVVHKVKAVLNINEPNEEFVYQKSLVATAEQFKETSFYVKNGGGYEKANSFVEGTQYYFRVPGGVYTLISIYDFGIGGSGVNVFDFYQPGTVIMRIGAGVPVEKRRYIQAKEKTPIIGRFYYTYNGSSKKYERYTGTSFEADTNYYYVAPEQSEDCIISIEGSEAKTTDKELAGVSEFSVPQALSFSSFCNIASSSSERPQLAYTKHLILGRLSGSGIDDLNNIQGYGLYADNVYLNGSLITKSLEGQSYTGINTLGHYSFNKIPEDSKDDFSDNSAIIFWGGAETIDQSGIQNAKFQVTQNGTMYAQTAILQDSVFVGGKIRSAAIETAEINGNGTTNPALKIKDAANGIAFYNGSNKVFSIGQNGFLGKNNNIFIDTNSDEIKFYGTFRSQTDSYYHLIDEYGCYFGVPRGDDYFDLGRFRANYDSTSGTGSLAFDIESSRRTTHTGHNVMELFKDRLNLNRDTYLSNNVYCGDNDSNGYAMEWRAVKNQNEKILGYDIYIY